MHLNVKRQCMLLSAHRLVEDSSCNYKINKLIKREMPLHASECAQVLVKDSSSKYKMNKLSRTRTDADKRCHPRNLLLRPTDPTRAQTEAPAPFAAGGKIAACVPGGVEEILLHLSRFLSSEKCARKNPAEVEHCGSRTPPSPPIIHRCKRRGRTTRTPPPPEPTRPPWLAYMQNGPPGPPRRGPSRGHRGGGAKDPRPRSFIYTAVSPPPPSRAPLYAPCR